MLSNGQPNTTGVLNIFYKYTNIQSKFNNICLNYDKTLVSWELMIYFSEANNACKHLWKIGGLFLVFIVKYLIFILNKAFTIMQMNYYFSLG